jgi:hypothetical protein
MIVNGTKDVLLGHRRDRHEKGFRVVLREPSLPRNKSSRASLYRGPAHSRAQALFPWLQAQYRIWARTTEEASRASTLIGLAELALSGCTTVFDHTYVFKNGNNVDCQIQAAKDIGVRFHASRGSMSLGQSQGGLPPDDCVEDEAFIIRDSERVIKAYHETSPGAMTRNGQRLFDLDTWRSCITRGLEVCGPKWPRKLSPGFTLGHSRPH